MATKRPWQTVWITGASSGMGYEMALQLARGGAMVAASARSADSLAKLAAEHANITPFPLDVTNPAAVAETTQRIAATLGPIDLAILNAGVWHPMPAKDFKAAQVAEAVNVNFLGITNALEPLIPVMLARGTGHIALVSSVAAYRGLPQSAAYAPTKAAINNLAECLHAELYDKGITVSLVCPGFVETPMTRVNRFPMPFIIKADDAARRIIRGLTRRRYEIAFPWPMALLTKAGRLAPNRAYFWILRMFNPLG